ncbi:hypothetical protein ALC60_01916 [Trachymyrmex zeteki]|uniref:Uncharacterized protein n=1 Tax=Mycetomoellerius zeteki TaxID=64791 RepID=A0A151XFH6_9HYME|nr:hypothetical protein ALC60_01916 [Trachymyrmex zeteki]
MVLVREFTSIFISTRRQLFTLAAGVANHSTNLPEYEGAIKWSDDGVSFGRGMLRREAGRLRSRSLAPPPVYTTNVGSNSSWLVATKSIPDHSQISSKSKEYLDRHNNNNKSNQTIFI